MLLKKTLPFYTLIHFLVDLTCIFRLFSAVQPQVIDADDWLLLVVSYNFLAFALPAFGGLIADFADRNNGIAAAGCVLVGIGGAIWSPALASVLFCGIGNGLFHVGAGRQVLTDAGGRYAPPGIFICSGTFGVYLGVAWRRQILHPLDHILVGAMFASAVILAILSMKEKRSKGASIKAGTARRPGERTGKEPEARTVPGVFPNPRFTLPVLLILLVVFLRSFYGFAVSYDWKNTFLAGLIFTACVAAGKAAGGLFADRFGITKVTVVSLAGAAVSVLFSAQQPVLGCVSILLFNMTMPLTLTLIAEYWKAWPGLAFGILMMALFLGTLPNEVMGVGALPMWGLALVSLVSLVLLWGAIPRKGAEGGN